MYLYFDKLGVLKTIIPHGEIPRQGSTLNLYVCFDEDFFESKAEQDKHSVNIDLILPNNEVGTKNMVPTSKPYLKTFLPVSSSEVTYDFIPGVDYLTYHFSFTPEQATAFAGKVIANISIVEIIEKEDGKLEDDTIYFGRAEIFVEKTFGNAKLTVNEASLHYKNLTNQINKINEKIANLDIGGSDVFTIDSNYNPKIKTKDYNLLGITNLLNEKYFYTGDYKINYKIKSFAAPVWDGVDGEKQFVFSNSDGGITTNEIKIDSSEILINKDGFEISDTLEQGKWRYNGGVINFIKENATSNIILPRKGGVLATQSEIPTKISDLENNSGFLTDIPKNISIESVNVTKGLYSNDTTLINKEDNKVVVGEYDDSIKVELRGYDRPVWNNEDEVKELATLNDINDKIGDINSILDVLNGEVV